jgi:Carboxypeptidase regulatory-like domain
MSGLETIRHRAAISGYVTDAITGQAISGVIIEVREGTLKTQTASDGFFYFVDLDAGLYTLSISAPILGSRYGTAGIPNLGVQDGPDGRPMFDPKANVALPPTRLTGYVRRSSDGQPLKGALVQVLGSEAKTVTDQNGKYAITGLQSGTPNVQASAEGRASVVQKVTLEPGTETAADFSLANS